MPNLSKTCSYKTMKTLHLILKGVWYDKIASGEKIHEYRACSDYWNTRFAKCRGTYPYETVKFRRGYHSDAPTMEFKIKKIFITNKPNDLGLAQCWEIDLGARIN